MKKYNFASTYNPRLRTTELNHRLKTTFYLYLISYCVFEHFKSDFFITPNLFKTEYSRLKSNRHVFFSIDRRGHLRGENGLRHLTIVLFSHYKSKTTKLTKMYYMYGYYFVMQNLVFK